MPTHFQTGTSQYLTKPLLDYSCNLGILKEMPRDLCILLVTVSFSILPNQQLLSFYYYLVHKRILDLQVAGRRKRCRPRMSWRELVDGDLRDWGLSHRDTLDREFCKRTLASRMQCLTHSCV